MSLLLWLRESVRQNVRQALLFFPLTAGVLFVLLNLTPAGYDPANLHVALLLAFLLFLPAWFAYRIVRFAFR